MTDGSEEPGIRALVTETLSKTLRWGKKKKNSFLKAKMSWKWQKTTHVGWHVHGPTPTPRCSSSQCPCPLLHNNLVTAPLPAEALPYQVSRRGGSSWRRLGCPCTPRSWHGVTRAGRSSPTRIGATLVTLGCALEELRPILRSGGFETRRRNPLCTVLPEHGGIFASDCGSWGALSWLPRPGLIPTDVPACCSQLG